MVAGARIEVAIVVCSVSLATDASLPNIRGGQIASIFLVLNTKDQNQQLMYEVAIQRGVLLPRQLGLLHSLPLLQVDY